jgi:uncharacterized membrane protein YgcG
MMKKISLTIVTILILTLTACGSATTSNDSSSFPPVGSPAGELSASAQLIIGTLKLKETQNAVTAEQAAELLPLWQTMQVLSESDSAAVEETEALIAQIQESMTAGQVQAITDMNLTREDMMTIMQEQGMAMGAGGQGNSSQSGNSSSSGQAVRPGGGMPPPNGEFPGGGPGIGGGGQSLSPDQIATAQASRQQSGGSFVPPVLINALIEYLQEKAGP